MEADDKIYTGAAGCGMGMYAIVLVVICGIGVIGMFGATLGLLHAEPDGARTLVHGSKVAVWRLQPMRDVGLLKLTEVPQAWHDESPRFDGTTACVMTPAYVGRVEDGTATTLAWADITATNVARTETDQMTIEMVGDNAQLSCHFGPNEGADRFLRMVESERQSAGASSPEDPPAN